MSAAIFLTVLTNLTSPGLPNPIVDIIPGAAAFLARPHTSALYAIAFSVLSLLPVLLAVWIAAGYLRRETDEFVRALVVRALLCGFAVTMAGDAVLGVLTMLYKHPFPISLLNADLFFASTGISFRLLRWEYR